MLETATQQEKPSARTHRVWNFNPGPATLPQEVLEQAREGLLDYNGTGMGVMELSHRSKPYEEIHYGLMNSIRGLLGVRWSWFLHQRVGRLAHAIGAEAAAAGSAFRHLAGPHAP